MDKKQQDDTKKTKLPNKSTVEHPKRPKAAPADKQFRNDVYMSYVGKDMQIWQFTYFWVVNQSALYNDVISIMQ